MAATTATLPPLLRLPTELLDAIISHLDFPGLSHLRATSRAMSALIPAQAWDGASLASLADGSAWAARRNRLACRWCARMLPATRFTDEQKRVKKARMGGRACVACLLPCSESPFWDELLWRHGAEESGGWNHECSRPRNEHRTRLSRERRLRALEEGGEDYAGVCAACHNVFVRWGRQDAQRGVCVGCWAEASREGALKWDRARRYELDLERAGVGERMGLGRELEFWQVEEWDEEWWYKGCGDVCCWDVGPVPAWREGWRGVCVVKRGND